MLDYIMLKHTDMLMIEILYLIELSVLMTADSLINQ
jgi:hypothetical protein